jgi:EAL domain-containing protein (putative c-di-GMP-specific phosphodiesterase class I)/CheY-like chemotaxis protein
VCGEGRFTDEGEIVGVDSWELGREGAGPGRVLVVDDDPVGRSVVAGVLRDAGFRTIEADSGTAALDVLAGFTVDAALIDHSMPGMSGLELTVRVRQMPEYQMLPILFLSATDSPETRMAALDAGATDFMSKPFPYDEIAARLRSQMQLSARWAATVHGLEDRATVVADLAGLGADLNPAVLSRRICERISRAHGGAGVAVFSWLDRSGEPLLLASSGGGPDVFADAGAMLSLRGQVGPWIEYPAEAAGGNSIPGWVVCCPLQRRQTTVGLLVIEGGNRAQEEMLAAGMDYAPTVALLLGQALSDSHRTRETRAMVERTLRQGAFEPVFQPIVDLGTGEVLGYEALTRLASGDPIVRLLAEATEAGIRAQTEISLLSAALRDARSLRGAWVSLNVSPSVVVDHAEELASLIDQSECQVVIELTENERIEDYATVRRALSELGERVKVSVDDTGAGYASLRHVIDLHPHYLKLDRSWISGLDQDQTRQALVAGMVAFCRHTDTEMIAEGVETESELATLRALDVRLAQGYLLGRPAPLEKNDAPSPTRV